MFYNIFGFLNTFCPYFSKLLFCLLIRIQSVVEKLFNIKSSIIYFPIFLFYIMYDKFYFFTHHDEYISANSNLDFLNEKIYNYLNSGDVKQNLTVLKCFLVFSSVGKCHTKKCYCSV